MGFLAGLGLGILIGNAIMSIFGDRDTIPFHVALSALGLGFILTDLLMVIG